MHPRLAKLAACIALAGCPGSVEQQPCAKACADPSGPLTLVCIDQALDIDSVKGAVRMWSDVLCDRTFEVQQIDGEQAPVSDCDVTLLFADSSWDWISAAGSYDIGFADPDRGLAWIIVDRVPPGFMKVVAAHELGHLLGILADSSGIMADPIQDTCVTETNVEEVP